VLRSAKAVKGEDSEDAGIQSSDFLEEKRKRQSQ